MKATKFAATSALAAAAALAACAHMSGADWVTMIDGGQGLDNFNRTGDANWHVADGALVADAGKGGYLVSKNVYRDFEIRAEFWAATDTNSGVFLRCADPAKPGAGVCYEVNIWDIRPEPKYATGAIVDVATVPVPLVHKAGGRWNTYEITARGTELTVKLNGVVTASVKDGKHASGPFALQFGPGVKGAISGPIKWRKVQIRSL
ncbi:MAG TPA: DUF1080 domain-containing protein [Burkholderiales bacterium]|jgi:hypothetical protein|nr:DUF1080 domain-containing protein [Burkholderiales bacterium]